MADDFKSTVSRNINTTDRQYTNVIWQAGKPPLDSELNLVGQIATSNLTNTISASAHSGVLMNPRSADRGFIFHPRWSNFLKIKPFKALINGMVIDVEQTQLNLPPPPTDDNRIDFVFLEVWKAIISAQGSGGSTTNKPTATTVYSKGNVNSVSGLPDEMVDSNVGFETTKRVQIQYRFRVVDSVSISSNSEGMTSGRVKAQGPLDTPSVTIGFNNQYANGDAGLWVAHMTTDGLPWDPTEEPSRAVSDLLSENIVYAIPICAISRRNTNAYVAINSSGNANQNGAIDRKPSSTTSADATTLTEATLFAALTISTVGNVQLVDGDGSGLDGGDELYGSNRFLVLGSGLNREIIEVSGFAAGNINVVSRGQGGTQAKYHPAGTPVSLFNNRPDGKYADQIHQDDLFDMRHATIIGEWDYQSLLESSLSDLLLGNLKTAFKQNALNNTTEGVVIEEVSQIDSQNLNQAKNMDYPNGFRDTWSDGSVPQMGITQYLKVQSATDGFGVTTETLLNGVASDWEIGPNLQPKAFVFEDGPASIEAGCWIKINLSQALTNLAYGVNQYKNPNSLTESGVRFIAPKEIRDLSTKRAPFTIEELGQEHSQYPHYPTLESNFEKPFIVLGNPKHTDTFQTVTTGNAVTDNFLRLYRPTAQNFSNVVKSKQTGADPTSVSKEDLVYAVRLGPSGEEIPSQVVNLEHLITNNQIDLSGDSSSLYAVLYGNNVTKTDNGIFKVVQILDNDSATTSSVYYTDLDASNVWDPAGNGGSKVGFIILKPIDSMERTAGLSNGKVLKIEFRTQDLSDIDNDVLIGITESVPHDVPNDILGKLQLLNEFQLGVSILYPPTTGGTTSVAKEIHKIGLRPPNTTGEFLNNSKADLHGNGFQTLPLVENEIDLPTKNHVSLWNRLMSSNLPIGLAGPDNLGGRIINEEADREAETFTDENSKTIVIRPYQKKTLKIHKATGKNLALTSSLYQATTRLVPEHWEEGAVDVDTENSEMFLSGKNAAYVLPEALMPRFGRQDIPLHTYTGVGDQFRNGLNHLFIDRPLAASDDVFKMVGGLTNAGASSSVNAILFATGTDAEYGERKSIVAIQGDEGIGARKTTLTVPTSDFGSTLNGIELPPYYGIARVYGVYEKQLYKERLGGTGLGGHDQSRTIPANNVTTGLCPNLLRTDTSSFTMYINKDGGKVRVRGVNDDKNTSYQNAHTYMITEHAIDISRLQGKTLPNGQSVGWTEASTFNSFDYVVEAVVFMFADGFITSNRFIIPRNYDGSGNLQDATSIQKLQVDTVIPFAPPSGSHITVAYKRTPYQGDPFNTLSNNDQQVQQGRKSLAELALGTKNQNTLSLTNRRNLQVLASMDFYTTLGTGKIGGAVYPTTITDVGYTPFPIERNPTLLEGITHIPLKTSTFTEDSTHPGGWCSLFLFEQAETTINGNALFRIYRDNVLSINFEPTGASYDTVEEQVNGIMVWLQDQGFNCFQIRGEINQNGNANSSYFGILIQAPNPVNDYMFEVRWPDLRNGQSVQIFEGLREKPLSFEMYSIDTTPNPDLQKNLEYKLNSRTLSRVNFSKVSFTPLNAGDGDTPISLTGITSRLPIGSLVRDSDFVCEDILGDKSSYLFSSTGSFSTITNPVPVSNSGVPYTATLGIAGDILQMVDCELYSGINPASQTKYTMSRGGGSVFGVGGEIPGGPLSFLATSFSSSLQPVLKGSVLAGRAMLVVNEYEEDDTSAPKNYGSELQLLVVTHAVDGGSSSITIGGDISPSGYGEGFSAADRFRIKGKPLVKLYGTDELVEVAPAPYNS